MIIKEKENQIAALIYIFFMGFGYPLIRYISTIFQTVNTNALMFLAGGLLLNLNLNFWNWKIILDYFQDLYL